MEIKVEIHGVHVVVPKLLVRGVRVSVTRNKNRASPDRTVFTGFPVQGWHASSRKEALGESSPCMGGVLKEVIIASSCSGSLLDVLVDAWILYVYLFSLCFSPALMSSRCNRCSFVFQCVFGLMICCVSAFLQASSLSQVKKILTFIKFS